MEPEEDVENHLSGTFLIKPNGQTDRRRSKHLRSDGFNQWPTRERDRNIDSRMHNLCDRRRNT